MTIVVTMWTITCYDKTGEELSQIVVPTSARKEIFQQAHVSPIDSPLEGRS